LRREAVRAAERQATPEARWARRREEAREAAVAEDYTSPDEGREPDADPWDCPLRFDEPDEPVEYYCEGLKIAPSDGKITVIAGQPGAAKGPTANHLAVCFALGAKAFGQHNCGKHRVMILDFEGARLTRRRCRRLARGIGHEPESLQGELFVYDGNTLGDFSDPYAMSRLKAKADALGVDVIIVDSYMSAMMSSGLEPNSPQYATLAKALGALGKCVIVVAHANKASAKEDRAPRLSDIAYTGAFSAMAQTALVLHHPNPEDGNVVEIGCARAPEEGFAPFMVRFQGTRDEPLRVTIAAGADLDPAAIRPSKETSDIRKREAAAQKNADRIVSTLRDTEGCHNGATAAKIKEIAGIGMGVWGDALEAAKKRGLVELKTLPSTRSVTVHLTEAGGAKPKPGHYTLPEVGSVAGRG
jgi:hypothetical protein